MTSRHFSDFLFFFVTKACTLLLLLLLLLSLLLSSLLLLLLSLLLLLNQSLTQNIFPYLAFFPQLNIILSIKALWMHCKEISLAPLHKCRMFKISATVSMDVNITHREYIGRIKNEKIMKNAMLTDVFKDIRDIFGN